MLLCIGHQPGQRRRDVASLVGWPDELRLAHLGGQAKVDRRRDVAAVQKPGHELVGESRLVPADPAAAVHEQDQRTDLPIIDSEQVQGVKVGGLNARRRLVCQVLQLHRLVSRRNHDLRRSGRIGRVRRVGLGVDVDVGVGVGVGRRGRVGRRGGGVVIAARRARQGQGRREQRDGALEIRGVRLHGPGAYSGRPPVHQATRSSGQ